MQLDLFDIMFFCRYIRGFSSVVEHSTAHREVHGSTPRVPSRFLCCVWWYSKMVQNTKICTEMS